MNSSNMSHFTDEEIKEQLNILGFRNIPKEKFDMFKKDLEKLIVSETSLNNSIHSSVNSELISARNYQENDLLNRKKVTFPYERTLSLSQPKNKSEKQEEDDEEENTENDTSLVSVTTTSSVVDNKVIKRKIIRKNKISDVKKSNENVEVLADNFKQISFNDDTLEDQDDETLDQSQNISVHEESDRENQYYSDEEQTVKMNDLYPSVNYPIKSFIRCQSALSLKSCDSNYSKPSLKSNPVKKYQDYQKMWNRYKVPGEKNHNDLRWSIREQMLQKHVVVKKQPKSYQPNTYAVPTLKKRQQLRWLVRSAMANPVDVL
ncbi:unnamed protein product [Brachionus calyciflorus]|uniref:Centriolar and ciliogenesis-associated protein HYLS1 C-terminal domain-containing protein n=1 Tax=Brachionus calyciflorus TaxID=104777 RepID=A0A813UH99_9BILA|nr:unnamed protein product [Brachionus calyciflorus]